MIDVPVGFRFAAVNAGVKSRETKKLDMGIILCDSPAVSAGVFTTNKVKAAPVQICIENIRRGSARAILANSGNANACTGSEGIEDARNLMNAVAASLGISPEEILPISTGVIGLRLPVDRMLEKVALLAESLGNDPEPFETAIMTTDTFAKIVSRKAGEATILGFAKGAGMIAPNMATMLSVVLTDAKINIAQLKNIVNESADNTFNVITVDGDMSTNDTLIAMSSGRVEAALDDIKDAIRETIGELAMMVVRDGEGATKLVKVIVNGAVSRDDARTAAMAVANSLLVKTAMFGADPNWGRIACALGYSGADVNPDKISIKINGLDVAEQGMQASSFDEEKVHRSLKQKEIVIEINLNIGKGTFTAWTTDISYDYVKINAEYRS
ncbi:MAG TPA: bifunctional glutamate N-acetyltransferase/amino-acid acetyltransferase ArgJ [Desulfomonilia bacterium]